MANSRDHRHTKYYNKGAFRQGGGQHTAVKMAEDEVEAIEALKRTKKRASLEQAERRERQRTSALVLPTVDELLRRGK